MTGELMQWDMLEKRIRNGRASAEGKSLCTGFILL